MPRKRKPDPFTHGPVDNDPLGLAQTVDRSTWGLPSDEGAAGQATGEVPVLYDYSGGVLVAHGEEAVAQAPPLHPELIRARVDAPHSFELPHEATHRRYEPLLVRSLAQGAAGFTLIAAAQGLHYVKLYALVLTLDAAGTIKFVSGSNDGTNVADVSGAMNFGGAATPPLILPPASLENPWLYTAPDQALGIFTVTGKANGWAMFAYSPYDS